jgi:hypothetical protein
MCITFCVLARAIASSQSRRRIFKISNEEDEVSRGEEASQMATRVKIHSFRFETQKYTWRSG